MAGIVVATAMLGSRIDAQATPDSALYVKAQQMVSNGEAEAGRKLVDSLVNAAPPESPKYAEGLYWRATLAPSANDAEKDYRLIVVDHPLSPRVPDALLRMGELESARGDRAAALQHFQRLTLEHPESPLHAEASYWLAHTYFETNDLQRGCAANADALALARPSNVELKNRIAFQQQRCRGVVLASGAGAAGTAAPSAESTAVASAVAPVVPSAAPDTAAAPKAASEGVVETPATKVSKTAARTSAVATRGATAKAASKHPATRAIATPARTPTRTPKRTPNRASARTPARTSGAPAAPRANGTFAVQVAAFGSKAQASELAVKLRGRGYSAHVDGFVAPYRVRVGSYSSRAAAVAELQRLKDKQISGFVTPE
ncbi:MAG: SPOR domain-containing protein [Gemmatimonadaceae bacterium]